MDKVIQLLKYSEHHFGEMHFHVDAVKMPGYKLVVSVAACKGEVIYEFKTELAMTRSVDTEQGINYTLSGENAIYGLAYSLVGMLERAALEDDAVQEAAKILQELSDGVADKAATESEHQTEVPKSSKGIFAWYKDQREYLNRILRRLYGKEESA